MVDDLKKCKEELILTKEFLRKALINLKKSIDFFDSEIIDIEDEEEKINKFISNVKRKIKI